MVAGEFAVAGEDIVLKPYPQETEWIEGRVIFEDDFISGLEHWNFLQSREEEDGSGLYEPFTAEAGRAIEAAIADPPRNGRKETGVLVKAGDASPSVAPLIVWNRTIEARAYSVEWICRFDLRETPGSSGGSHMLRVEGGRSIRSRSADVSTSQDYLWRVLREEVTPLDVATQPYAWKIRTLHDGSEISVMHANFSKGSIAFRVSRGNIFVSRCTVRELVPAGSRHWGDEERTRP